MDKGDSAFVELLLILVLVLNEVEVDEVAEVGARIPASIVGIDVYFPEFTYHVRLIGDVRFGARGGSGDIRGGVVVVVTVSVGLWNFDCRKGEGVGDLELGGDVHPD